MQTILTLDLFDSLVLRRCGCSEALADEIALAAARAGLVAAPEAYASAYAAALRALGPCADGDWPLATIHAAMPGLDAAVANALTELAVGVEVSTVVPNAALVARVHEERSHGTRLALVSDTHLPREAIGRVLAAAGLDASVFERIFLSSEGAGRKADGSLFRSVQAALRPAPGAWLHLGDNAVSDGLHAELAGARSELVRDSLRADERLVARLAIEVRPHAPGPVVIWGAGQRGWALLRACRSAGVVVDAFWDRSRRIRGRAVDGVPIHAPFPQIEARAVLLAVPAPPDRDSRMREFAAWQSPVFARR
jgi:FMN phosphatase YigB (HAD superfamily)